MYAVRLSLKPGIALQPGAGMTENKIIVSYSLPGELVKKLSDYAIKRGLSASEQASRAIYSYLKIRGLV